MQSNLRFKLLAIVAVILVCVYGIIGLPKSKDELIANWKKNIRLGLDLRGGSYLILQLQVQDAFKAEADQELSAFYQKVLPSDQTSARRMTYASLPALARKTGVRYEARSTSIEEGERDSRLGRMTIKMVLQGEYRNIRQFIYELESAPEFIIIDDLTLAESTANDPQTLTINLSTYYRLRKNAP